MQRLSGSKMDRAEACPASCALPAAYTPPGPDAEEGTAIHKFLETGEIPAAHMARCGMIDVAKARPEADGVDLREVSFCFDGEWGDSRYVPDRSKDVVGPSEIPMTVDRVWIRDGQLHVDDYKTGMFPPSSDGLLQLEIGAVCAARHLGCDSAEVTVVAIGQDGRVWRDSTILDVFDLEAAAKRCQRVWRAVERARGQATPDVTVGEHCRYCPAMAACPAQAGIVKRFADVSVDDLSVADVGRAWEQLQAAQQWLNLVEKAIKLRIDREGSIPLPSGGHVRPVETTRASVLADVAWPVLTELGIDPAAIVERKLGIGDVEAAAKAVGIKDIKARLIEANAIKLGTSTSYRKAAK